MFLRAIRNGSSLDDEILESSISVELSDVVNRPDRGTSDEENGKLGQVCEAKEKWCEDVRIS